MSEYGPAIFISRKDGEALTDAEQSEIQEALSDAAKALKIIAPMDKVDGKKNVVEPWKYDYDGYEPLAISFLLWSDYAFGSAPDFIQDDFHADAESLAKKIAKKFKATHPGVYLFQGYFVEN